MRPRASNCFLTATILLLFGFACYLGTTSTLASVQENQLNASTQVSSAVLAGAKETYESVCAACHGLDARGSERGPDIASRPEVVQKTDAELAQIISNGRTAAGMPSFSSFGSAKISALTAYLRILEGRGRGMVLPGDPKIGKALFFGKAKCSECHSILGHGGFLASDLTTYSGKLDASELREKVLNPDANLDPRRGLVHVVLSNGTELTGAIRNESNFSIQVQTADGTFHLLNKSDLRAQTYVGTSGMPRDYQSTLAPAELNDIISFVLRSVSDAVQPSSAKPPAEED